MDIQEKLLPFHEEKFVRALQRWLGVTEDGIFGPDTGGALGRRLLMGSRPPLPQAAGKSARIVLDPGHGETGDPGAVGAGGAKESEMVLRQAYWVAGFLQQQGHRVEIIKNSLNLSLSEIGRRGGGPGIDCFVSLHLNASANHNAQGHEVWVHRAGPKQDWTLARAVNNALAARLDIPDRGVKEAGFAVLATVPSPTAACLVESFFIDNGTPDDLATWLEQSARAIAEGINTYCGVG